MPGSKNEAVVVSLLFFPPGKIPTQTFKIHLKACGLKPEPAQKPAACISRRIRGPPSWTPSKKCQFRARTNLYFQMLPWFPSAVVCPFCLPPPSHLCCQPKSRYGREGWRDRLTDMAVAGSHVSARALWSPPTRAPATQSDQAFKREACPS